MAIKKSELYSSLWKSCDELRGGMDASQYKDYVLVLLFMKYVSDKYAHQADSLVEVPEGGGFADMVAAKGDKEIGEKIDKIIARFVGANTALGLSITTYFNDEEKLGKGKEMVDRLSRLVAIFEGLDFRQNRVGGDDLLGDAYEYLMRNFATESGKSKGQFYTPAEVSRVVSLVIGLERATDSDQTIYDPTCGSGSLLLKAHDEAQGRTGKDLALYGQEMDVATAGLARMNTILHDCPRAEIWKDNTLAAPHFTNSDGTLMTHDYIVANPPFSSKAWTNGFDPYHDLFQRFALGVPPPKNGDYAFVQHILTSLKSTGKGAVILPHGVLSRGNAEADIRRNIVQRGYLKGIIGLPANLFYGTGIPACILVLDKENAAQRRGIFMIDASKGFIKDGNKNRLRAQDIHRIVDVFTRQVEIDGYSKMVPHSKIEENDYNLNLPRYIDSSEPEDLQDIEAHLKGGLPARDVDALSAYWEVFPTLRTSLFTDAGRPGYYQLKTDAAQIKPTIFGHQEFTTFQASISQRFEDWKAKHTPALKGIKVGDSAKELIGKLSESLLETFQSARLVDAYDLYQHLMDYWDQTLQDDVYQIVQDGWLKSVLPRKVVEGSKEQPHFVVGGMKLIADIVPPSLIIARYFAKEKALLETLEAKAEELTRQREEFEEEHIGEDSVLEDAQTDSGTLTAVSAKARHREIKNDPTAATERLTIERYLEIIADETDAKKAVKEFQKALMLRVAKHYEKLTEAEIQTLVVEDKWMAALEAAMHSELDRVSQALTGRIKTLADRYSTPLPKLVEEVAGLEERVAEHLKKMGFVWN